MRHILLVMVNTRVGSFLKIRVRNRVDGTCSRQILVARLVADSIESVASLL